jgi:hypothetical protein
LDWFGEGDAVAEVDLAVPVTDTDGNSHHARRWEPKRLRLRLFSTAARIARTGRRTIVHLARNGAWTRLLHTALARPHALTAPG